MSHHVQLLALKMYMKVRKHDLSPVTVALSMEANTNCAILDTMFVNLMFPERNREVQIYCFDGLRNVISGYIIDGFYIVMPVDIRDANLDIFKAEICNENEIVITMPSLPYQIMYDSTVRFASMKAFNLLCARCQEAQEITITDMQKNPWRQLRKLRLIFPQDIVLINLDNALDEVLTLQEEPYSTDITLGGGVGEERITESTMYCNIAWRVGNQDTRRQAQGSANTKSSKRLGGLVKTMKSMKLSSPPPGK